MLFKKRKLLNAIETRSHDRLAALLHRDPHLANLVLNDEGQTALHLVAASGIWTLTAWVIETDGRLPEAKNDADLSLARLLIGYSAEVNRVDSAGNTPLHYACGRGHLGLMELLLDSGADVNAGNSLGATPLSFALHWRQDEIAAMVVDRGARLDYRGGDKKRGPLSTACEMGLSLAFDAMLHRRRGLGDVDVNESDPLGDQPLHWAARTDRSRMARELLNLGVDVNVRGGYLLTALHLSASKGHEETTRLLLNSGAELDARSDIGQTPLHMAVGYGHFLTSKMLVYAGADPSPADRSGLTPLHMAAAKGRTDLVSLLVAAGADIDARDASGDTADKWAADNGFTGVRLLCLA